MFQHQLFFGFLIEADFSAKLQAIDPKIRDLFIQNDANYLQTATHNKKTYLGKFIGKKGELSQLEQLEANIFSLLKKLVPDFPYEKHSLILFSIPDNERS
jgi:hypothetical protein